MLYADEYYKYKAEKGLDHTLLLPEINWFEKIILKLKGYKIYKLPKDPEE